MPFHEEAYYPYSSDTQGIPSSSLLNSPPSPASREGVVLPFKFCLRRESVDWRQINAVDMDLLVSQVDVDLLQEHISTVTFCNLEGECCLRCRNPMDPILVKLLRLAQLSLEWLIYSQKVLTHNLSATEERLVVANKEHQQLLKKLNKKEEKEKKFVRELKHRKEIICFQQSQIVPRITRGEHCQHCEKSFLNFSSLQSHMQRRHPKEHIQWRSDNVSMINSLTSENESLKSELISLKEQIDQQRQAFEAKKNQEMEQQSQKDLLTEHHNRAEVMAQMERKIEDTRDSTCREIKFPSYQNTQVLNIAKQNVKKQVIRSQREQINDFYSNPPAKVVEVPVIVSSSAPEELSEEESDSSSMSEKRSAERNCEHEFRKDQLECQREEASHGLTDKTPSLSSNEKSESEMEEVLVFQEHLQSKSPQPSLNQSSNASQQLQSHTDQDSNEENRNQEKTNNVARKIKMTQRFKQFWTCRHKKSIKEKPGPAPACGNHDQVLPTQGQDAL